MNKGRSGEDQCHHDSATYHPIVCLLRSFYGAIGSVCVCGGGISESNTVNKQEWGEGEGEERNMEVLFITLVGE